MLDKDNFVLFFLPLIWVLEFREYDFRLPDIRQWRKSTSLSPIGENPLYFR